MDRTKQLVSDVGVRAGHIPDKKKKLVLYSTLSAEARAPGGTDVLTIRSQQIDGCLMILDPLVWALLADKAL